MWFISSDIASSRTRLSSAEDAAVVAASCSWPAIAAACAKSDALITVVAGASNKLVEAVRLPPSPLSKPIPSSESRQCVWSTLLPLMLLAMDGDEEP